ncbi:hypothetical protein X975_03267, partial [Stegodyphus mimosarum]
GWYKECFWQTRRHIASVTLDYIQSHIKISIRVTLFQ